MLDRSYFQFKLRLVHNSCDSFPISVIFRILFLQRRTSFGDISFSNNYIFRELSLKGFIDRISIRLVVLSLDFSLGVDIRSEGGIDRLDVDGLGEGAEEDGGDEEGAGEHLEFLSVLFIIIILIARARGHSLPKPGFSN